MHRELFILLAILAATASALEKPKAVVQQRCEQLCMDSMLKDFTFCAILCSFTTNLSNEEVLAELEGLSESDARQLLMDSSEDFARDLFKAKWAQAAKLGKKFIKTLRQNVAAARIHEDL